MYIYVYNFNSYFLLRIPLADFHNQWHTLQSKGRGKSQVLLILSIVLLL